MTKFQELLLAAGSVARCAGSATHRAVAVRAIDTLGLEWTAGQPVEIELLAAAIAANVRALAAVSTDDARDHVAESVKSLIAAERSLQAKRRLDHYNRIDFLTKGERKQLGIKPYWLDRDE